jgi:hypothetical protein
MPSFTEILLFLILLVLVLGRVLFRRVALGLSILAIIMVVAAKIGGH